jgi:predicted small lipoprotein YifL
MKQLGWIFVVGASVALGGCGMKGPLFLPDKNASVVTRPGASGTTTTPPAQTAPAQAPGDTTPSTPSTPKPQDKDKDDSQSTSSTPKS